tara:strand:+ start:5831 stop:6313 length:483 start_codon:yes stop_codon:yes gene_type:complete
MRILGTILISSMIIIAVSACTNSHVEDSTMAIGEVNQQQLMTEHQAFQQSYQLFQLSEFDIAAIKTWPSDVHIEVYFGTWCHDSIREVPRFLKIVAENSTISHRLIALDYEKSEPNGSAKRHNIKFTPSFIVYQSDKERGRIIERPTVSLTADISAMLSP